VTLSDLAKYSMTRGIARLLCNSWASCETCNARKSYGKGWYFMTKYISTSGIETQTWRIARLLQTQGMTVIFWVWMMRLNITYYSCYVNIM